MTIAPTPMFSRPGPAADRAGLTSGGRAGANDPDLT
jgi:hypothetical protein